MFCPPVLAEGGLAAAVQAVALHLLPGLHLPLQHLAILRKVVLLQPLVGPAGTSESNGHAAQVGIMRMDPSGLINAFVSQHRHNEDQM